MSEYWVSNKKFFCTYCRIYIQDNKISRQNHENGKKHKDNVAGYLRDVHKRQEEKSKEDKETLAILSQIEQAASRQYAQETGIRREVSAQATKPSRKTAADDAVAKILEAVHSRPRPVAEPAATLDSDAHPYGEWNTIPTPKEKPEKGGESGASEWADYGEEEPEEHVRGFKIQEKTIAVDAADEDGGETNSSATMFKKRKGASKAGRNVRKRME